jgi:haloacetate dehalogenase
MTADALLFPGFTVKRVQASGAAIHCVVGGNGPPLLMLHGYPQTHAMWHKVAGRLAATFTVVCADLRGYGDSSKPSGDARHDGYAKRTMAQDMVEAMQALGFDRFRLAGHDRGGRVAHRLAVDHADAVERVAVLDISPTRKMFGRTDATFARLYYHWFFLAQPFDHPERMIGADPRYYLRHKLKSWSADTPHFDPLALAEYERCFADPATIHASCEDYRAAATIDLEHDDADVRDGRRVQCPLLVLWGERGVVHRCFDPLRDWAEVAVDVRGRALPCAHYLAEEAPEETYSELAMFFAATS